MQVLSRWPRDKCKAPERDLRMFLEKELDKQLSADLKNGLVEAHVEQKLKCLFVLKLLSFFEMTSFKLLCFDCSATYWGLVTY